MPRFFLNVREGDELIYDPEGSDYLSIAEATAEAVLAAREMMANSIRAGRKPTDSRFEIGDDSGQIVLIMPFEEAIGSDCGAVALAGKGGSVQGF